MTWRLTRAGFLKGKGDGFHVPSAWLHGVLRRSRARPVMRLEKKKFKV